ncbi:MAG: DUF3363 domain-containing protein [Burkholderiales bacterium]|nr:MAG: DUF3363 domain-containing protein [Burkholderiales bacterium]
MVQRFGAGEFIVGHDHRRTALAFEEKLVKRAPFSVQVGSYWNLSEQVHARGPTHLDHALNGDVAIPNGESRVAREFDQALQQRRLFLIEQGWMGPNELGPSRHVLDQMAQAELAGHASALSGEFGMSVRTYRGHNVSGAYARRIDLAQGRLALIVGERQAHLVPWRPALERFAGRQVEGVMRGQTLAWSLAKGRGIGLGIE